MIKLVKHNPPDYPFQAHFFNFERKKKTKLGVVTSKKERNVHEKVVNLQTNLIVFFQMSHWLAAGEILQSRYGI